MNGETQKLGRTNAGFAIAAATAVLFNTVLTCVKDAYAPVAKFMASLTDHNWTTQGLADVALFFLLGWVFSKMNFAERMAPGRVVSLLIAAVVVAGAGLVVWFVVF